MSLEVVYLSPQALTPYEGNTRKHNPEDIEQIKESIIADGFNDPIGIWGEKNLIVEGHGRQIAAIELGLESVPCIRLDHLTDTQRRDYAIRHNRTAELSGWDFGKLEEEIARLEIEGVDLSGLKFDLDALNGVGNPEINIVEDEPPELPETPIAKLGDIWQLGRHRLMCGDSTDEKTVSKLMNGQKADLLLTDPPYGIDYGGMLKGKGDGKGGADKNGWKSYDAPDWDVERPNKNAFELMLKATNEQIIWGGNYFADVLPTKMCWLVWDKGQRDFSLADGELAWTSFEKALRIKTYSRANANRENKVHPTQKPIELLRWCIEDIAERNMKNVETILDLYGGSGSTLIACEQLNRTCYMMELDPHYCDVIIQRWENLTGEKAVLLNA
jgi:DNA modification methylase